MSQPDPNKELLDRLGRHADTLREIREQQALHTTALHEILRRLPEGNA